MATVLCAIAAFFFMQDVSHVPLKYFFVTDLVLDQYPDSATFLTETQKMRLLQTLREDTQGAATHFDMKFVWQALCDYKSWVQVFIYMGCVS